MQSLNIDAARRHGVEVVAAAGPLTGSTPISLNTPDILNTLISITNPFFDASPVLAANPHDSQNPSQALDEDKKVFATLETPGVQKCPVQSVSATRTHLIKESLKVAIQSKRKISGKEDIDLRTEMEMKTRKKDEVDSYSIDSESQATFKLTPEDEERRKRRRERNKIAATKCRNKKKEKTYLLVQESECLEDNNVSLKSEISKLEVERQRLVEVLAAHAPTCKQNMTSTYSDFNHNTSYYDQTIQL